MAQRALFLDRDGVVNVDRGYVHDWADFAFIPDIFTLLKQAKQKGYLLLLVTNQSGIGRGYYSQQDFQNLSDHMQAHLKKRLGFGLDHIYHCPHAPEASCPCRKPKLGMLRQALNDFDLNLDQSIMLGDKLSDMQFGLEGGMGTNLWLCSQASLVHKRLYHIDRLEQALDFLTPL